MKQKEDIYKKPKKLLSEYLTIIIVACVTTMFVSFEIYSFISHANQMTTLSNVKIDNYEEPIDINESILPSKNQQVLKRPKEQETEIELLEANITVSKSDQEKNITKPLVLEEKTQKPLNPIKDILKSKSESQSWNLLSSYKDYSLEDKHKLLIHAIENNHADNLAKMLKKGFILQTRFYEGNANKLIVSRKYKVVMNLIKSNLLDIHKVNKYGYTLLHEAAAKGHGALTRLLVLKGVDINAQALDGASALHYPSRLGYSITVKTLLDLGMDPNLKATLKYSGLYWNDSTPLHIASRRGHLKIVKHLLLGGADINLKDGDGLTALDLARNANKESIVRFLESELSKEEMLPTEKEHNSSQSVDPENSDFVSEKDVTDLEINSDMNSSLLTVDSLSNDGPL